MAIVVAGETLSLTRKFVGKTHRVLEHTRAHTLENQHQKGPICLWEVEKVTESCLRAQQMALFLSGLLPYIQHHNAVMWVALVNT